ncbi:P-loop containing nucleoside triphosphate hydrolase protein [Sphaerosporella brunnea]|uniref:P-loop containing nucleoside triphosphate hydrolase protein n=1 Tax=Sphaerosporella brunnea TaxID=1250544 RepID=A0A5J5EFR7_9PEZI|nr:P-loop containing nucleoside triphosphate hydrolase protein [Sphaerosporella brunnea]
MEPLVTSLVTSTLDRYRTLAPTQRHLISIAGIPGSGKTTLAAHVVRGLNGALGSEAAVMIPMDGYHLTRAQLSAMADPARAHYCRGAHWTFDPAALAALIDACRAERALLESVWAASFDHALKDPVEGGVEVKPQHRILIFEGNYLSLSAPEEWRPVADAFDERWFVEVDEDVAKRRLAKRHVAAGICSTLEEGLQRAEGNDIPNGRFLRENRVEVDKILRSEEDEGFAIGK